MGLQVWDLGHLSWGIAWDDLGDLADLGHLGRSEWFGDLANVGGGRDLGDLGIWGMWWIWKIYIILGDLQLWWICGIWWIWGGLRI